MKRASCKTLYREMYSLILFLQNAHISLLTPLLLHSVYLQEVGLVRVGPSLLTLYAFLWPESFFDTHVFLFILN